MTLNNAILNGYSGGEIPRNRTYRKESNNALMDGFLKGCDCYHFL